MRTLLIAGSCLLVVSTIVVPASAAVNDAPSYCINQKGEFYPYVDGENCKRGYQVGPGNCRLPTGKVLAAVKEECFRQSGSIQLPFPAVLTGPESAKPADPKPEPLTLPKND